MMGRAVLVRALAAAMMVAGVGLFVAERGDAAPQVPSVALRGVLTHVDASRSDGDTGLFVITGVYAEAVHGAFEIDVTNRGTVLWQVRRTGDTVQRLRKISPSGRVTLGNGLPGFFVVTVTNAGGKVVSHSLQDWCPFATARMDMTGPTNPIYPFQCGSPLTKATPWGLDQGWGSELFPNIPFSPTLADGDYGLTIAIASTYARQLQVPAAVASVHLPMTVTTDTGGCGPKCPPPVPGARALVRRSVPNGGSAFSANTGLSGVPDMQSLPAHDLSIESDSGHDYLDFAATIWNGGSGPLWLEGFRSGTSSVMPVTQFFYVNDQQVGSQPAGNFVFDNRVGHDVWDMPDIAQYDLLNKAGDSIVQSQKQSFCLGATDPIDLLQPGADFQPGQYESSSCGGTDAAWIRETLAAGWGDTYFQNAACQAFDITNLPNGVYQIKVTTDPNHVLKEASYTNNSALVKVRLGGTPGNRTVTTV